MTYLRLALRFGKRCCFCLCRGRWPAGAWPTWRGNQREPIALRVETGPNIELLTLTTKTAVSLSPTTGRVPNSALNPGSAEVPDFAREVDGALDTTDVREPHSQIKPQVSPLISERVTVLPSHKP